MKRLIITNLRFGIRYSQRPQIHRIFRYFSTNSNYQTFLNEVEPVKLKNLQTNEILQKVSTFMNEHSNLLQKKEYMNVREAVIKSLEECALRRDTTALKILGLSKVDRNINLRKGNLYILGFCVPYKDVEVAFKYFLQAAEYGDPDCQFITACLYMKGFKSLEETIGTDFTKENFLTRNPLDPRVEVDEETGAFIFVDQRSERNRYAEEVRKTLRGPKNPIGVSEEIARLQLKENKRKAVYWLKKASENGVPKAKILLSQFYLEGKGGLKKDIYQARDLLLEAAKSGNADAYYNLGQMYYIGMKINVDDQTMEIKKDVQKAIQYFIKASELGDSASQYWLGHAYHQGNHVEKDITKALEYFEKAIQQNHPGAMYYLGLMYRTGDGVEQNEQKWEELFKRAVDLEWGPALYCLADMYFHGTDGRNKDVKKAHEYYMKAGDKGEPNALYCLGVMHYHGIGVEKDLNKAFKFYNLAASAGNLEALPTIASMLMAGEGTQKDEKQAKHLMEMYKSLKL